MPVAARRLTGLGFGDLDGWAEDDHAAALRAFRATCDLAEGDGWTGLARDIRPESARGFFEARFRPVLIEDGSPALFTGYYEPEIEGSPVPSDRYPAPLYRLPPGLPWLTRAEIEDGALAGRGLEIAWVEDAVEAFFLQVQGSGRVRLPDGRVLRLGYAGKNGHPYASVGRLLIERGALVAGEATADAVRGWLRRNPEEGRTVMRANASFVFFRELELPSELGPLGAMGRPVTPLRSLAVDPGHVPLGAPIWIEANGAERLRRLMIAQDVGGAIKGAQRGDIFVGTGAAAGLRAGRIRDGGRMVVLLPLPQAQALLAAAS
ncbi:Membrane-bound lytic murein transglycosylase A precursor [Rubellimicrobium mesophilum DSM 19309]|uniref:peptidoglycan lytic exotransglycosylase n=1 Tax=Rubellimicrobium mesophilum DSM 19309 TaxID=442562 RepID=A0A017HIL7_9RHOB|nr:Membrane-bound lytic murein transglycosylase A precursor [Rubellimicrobium mesophilum DSM 19309]